jgi:hypothetical protein
MRHLLAAIFLCAIALPEASASPTVGPKSVSVSRADPIMQVAKRARPRAQRQSRGDSGIHPLVGSGDY